MKFRRMAPRLAPTPLTDAGRLWALARQWYCLGRRKSNRALAIDTAVRRAAVSQASDLSESL
jgi:hypothetical protein